MATTLKITPTLKGKDSKRFNNEITSDKFNKISDAKKNKMLALVGKVLAKKPKKCHCQIIPLYRCMESMN